MNELPQQIGDGTHICCPPPLTRLSSARRRTTRHIHLYESSLVSLECKLTKRTNDWKCSKIIKDVFESKGDPSKCQLKLALLKSHCLAVVAKILGINIVRLFRV